MFNPRKVLFGKATKLSIPFYEIKAIKKAKFAKLIGNAIKITTTHNKRIKFSSINKRNEVYNLLKSHVEENSGRMIASPVSENLYQK